MAPPIVLPLERARALWLEAQRLHTPHPFGTGPAAVRAAVEHLGYVQIDTIHVVERCHHHILATRVPGYRREDLDHVQRVEKSVFEYWTHALSYVPTRDYRFFRPAMLEHRREPMRWFGSVDPADARRVLRLIRRDGPLSIRDIDDEELVEKDHEWASRKPSKRALQLHFFDGRLTVSGRGGMLKTYDLTERHFGWDRAPRGASEREIRTYLIDRALRSQGVVSAASVCHLDRWRKPSIADDLRLRARRGELVPVTLAGDHAPQYWVEPTLLEETHETPDLVHVLSPFDPLVIQRDRTERFFGYRHIFEAYVPKPKRRFGYFALPVLVGDRFAAAIDLKTDRSAGTVLIQQWTWLGDRRRGDKPRIEEALHDFERFQLALP